jgi:hypothetical protein
VVFWRQHKWLYWRSIPASCSMGCTGFTNLVSTDELAVHGYAQGEARRETIVKHRYPANSIAGLGVLEYLTSHVVCNVFGNAAL